MLKITEIVEIAPYNVVCRFNTGEVKKIALESHITSGNHTINKAKLLDKDFFKQVKIGQFGELYWADAAYMQDSNEELLLCEFDLSPEFVYYNATEIFLSPHLA